MYASKTPAYFGLIVAVVAGVLLSHAGTPIGGGEALQGDPAGSPSAMALQASATTPSEPVKHVIWKSQTLYLGSLRIRSDLPVADSSRPHCIPPSPTEDEVGVCQPDGEVADSSVWQIRVVTQKDRFVPLSWFEDSLNALRVSAGDDLVRRLGIEANQVTGADFRNAALLSATQLPGTLAIRGAATAPKAFGSDALQSCIYAFLLWQNRPATALYCAGTDSDALEGAQKLVHSLQTNGTSTEYKRGSAGSVEHATYLKKLKRAGGAAAIPDFVSAEKAFETTATTECQKYGALSQEKFQCFEAFASARLDQLSAVQ